MGGGSHKAPPAVPKNDKEAIRTARVRMWIGTSPVPGTVMAARRVLWVQGRTSAPNGRHLDPGLALFPSRSRWATAQLGVEPLAGTVGAALRRLSRPVLGF